MYILLCAWNTHFLNNGELFDLLFLVHNLGFICVIFTFLLSVSVVCVCVCARESMSVHT